MEHHKYRRALCCLIFGALGLVQIAFAQATNPSKVSFGEWIYQKQTWDRFWYTGNPTTGYTPTPTNRPSPASTPVGNWNLDTTGGIPRATTKTPFTFPNAAPEIVDVSAKFKMRDLAGALGRFAQKAIPVFALGGALFDLARELGFWLSRNPDGSLNVERDSASRSTTPYVYYWNDRPTVVYPSIEESCSRWTMGELYGAGYINMIPSFPIVAGKVQCTWHATKIDTGQLVNRTADPVQKAGCMPNWTLQNGSCNEPSNKQPSSLSELEDAIANKTDYSPTSKIINATRDAINAEPTDSLRPKLENPTLTGPATGSQPRIETKTNTDGSTSMTTTTQNYNYIDNSIKNSTTSVTNNYNPTTNTTTTTTTTNNSPNPEPPKDFCENNPERLGCLDIDTPTVDIPKKDKNVTYAAENLFGGGTCPSPKTATYFGNQLSFSFQPTCDALQNYIRYMIISAALYAAYLMIVKSLKG